MSIVRSSKQRLIASIVMAVLSLAVLQVHNVSAGRYYTVDDSGQGTTTGTGAYTTTWTNWNASIGLPEGDCTGGTYCAYGQSFTDEAVWISDQTNQCGPGCQLSIEAGIGSGYGAGPGNPGWQSGINPYFTLTDGGYEVNAPSTDDLPGDTYIWMADHVYNGGSTCATVQVDNWIPSLGSGNCEYGFVAPRLNYTQGETEYGDDYMGGGATETFTMYFQPESGYPNGWNKWGQSNCGIAYPSGGAFNYYCLISLDARV